MGFAVLSPSYGAVSRRGLLRAALGAASFPLWSTKAMAAAAMITRPIPSSGEAMPVIGLGTWQVFDVGPEERARQQQRAVLQALASGGGRLIDSSPMYGRAEGVTGDLVSELGLRPR